MMLDSSDQRMDGNHDVFVHHSSPRGPAIWRAFMSAALPADLWPSSLPYCLPALLTCESQPLAAFHNMLAFRHARVLAIFLPHSCFPNCTNQLSRHWCRKHAVAR
jgi:hypothetical protein